MSKLKVVLICHFSNEEIREKLPLSRMKIKQVIKFLFGKAISHSYSDFAPWVTNLINEFEGFEDIELHVIAPYSGLINFTYEFEMRGVSYHFFQPDLPLLHVNIPMKYCMNSQPKYLRNRYYVKKFLNTIKPDIVNLIGTENPYYSITSLDINNIPVYVSAQTVYTNPNRKKYSDSIVQLNWDVELKIHQKEKYFGCGGRMHRDLILINNPNAIIFKMFFPIEQPKAIKKVPKVFDFVFFAGIAKKKGIEDLIDAMALVKKEKIKVSLNIIGSTSQEYLNFIKNKISVLQLENNIVINDYFPVHSDMHQHIVQSRFAVLPVKLDVIPGSVIEAILLDLPLVTYKTSGTPYLNRDGKAILLADIGDIEKLAANMIQLLNNPELGINMRRNAKAFVEKEFDNTTSAKRLISNYKAAISHYHENQSVPENLLFDVNEFPIY